MEAVSYAHSAKQAKRIKSFIENPDSNSGIVTVPKTIGAGESVTIPAGRVAVLPNVQVDGTLNIEGEVFIPSGATFGDLDNQIALKADTSYVNGKYSGFKNFIINGNFDVWQRGPSQTLSGYGSADRWLNIHSGSTKTISRQFSQVLSANVMSTVVTSVAGDNNYVRNIQRIEDITKYAGKTITVSFEGQADSNKNIAISFSSFYGTGGTPSAQEDYGITLVPLTTTFGRKTITVTVPSIAGKTLGADGVHTSFLQIQFWFDAGSGTAAASLGQQSGTFDIAQVQLEEGSVATPFESRPYGLELSLCQRYYEYGSIGFTAYSLTGAGYGQPYRMSVIKRVTPTVVLTNLIPVNTSEAGLSITTTHLSNNGYATTAGMSYWSAEYTASAEL